MQDEQDEDGDSNTTDELCGSDDSGGEDAGDGHCGNHQASKSISPQQSTLNPTVTLLHVSDDTSFEDHAGTGSGYYDTHDIAEPTLLQEKDEIRNHDILNGSRDRHNYPHRLVDAYKDSDSGIGKKDAYQGTRDSTLPNFYKEYQTNHLQHSIQDVLSDDNDSLMGDVKQPEELIKRGMSSENKPEDLSLPQSDRNVYETLSKIFTDNQPDTTDTSGWHKQLGIALQLLAPDSLQVNVPNNLSKKSSATSLLDYQIAQRNIEISNLDQSCAEDNSQISVSNPEGSQVHGTSNRFHTQWSIEGGSLLENPNPSASLSLSETQAYIPGQERDVIKTCTTKIKNIRKPAIPWSQEDDELLIHLKNSTGMSFKRIATRITRRSPSSISAHWSFLCKSARNNNGKPYLKAALLAAMARRPHLTQRDSPNDSKLQVG